MKKTLLSSSPLPSPIDPHETIPEENDDHDTVGQTIQAKLDAALDRHRRYSIPTTPAYVEDFAFAYEESHATLTHLKNEIIERSKSPSSVYPLFHTMMAVTHLNHAQWRDLLARVLFRISFHQGIPFPVTSEECTAMLSTDNPKVLAWDKGFFFAWLEFLVWCRQQEITPCMKYEFSSEVYVEYDLIFYPEVRGRG